VLVGACWSTVTEKRAPTPSEQLGLLRLQPSRKEWSRFRTPLLQPRGLVEGAESSIKTWGNKEKDAPRLKSRRAIARCSPGWMFNGQARDVRWSCHIPRALRLPSRDLRGSCVGTGTQNRARRPPASRPDTAVLGGAWVVASESRGIQDLNAFLHWTSTLLGCRLENHSETASTFMMHQGKDTLLSQTLSRRIMN